MKPLATALLTLAVIAASLGFQFGDAGTITETATTRRYQESFESFTPGVVPGDTWYTVSNAGSGANQVEATTATGSTQAWLVQDASAAYAAQIDWNSVGVDFCSSSQVLEFDVIVPDLPLGATVEVRIGKAAAATTAAPAASAGLRFTGSTTSTDNTLDVFTRGDAGAVQTTTYGTVPGGALRHVTISNGNCPAAGAGAASWNFKVGSGPAVARTAAVGDTISGPMTRLAVVVTAGAAARAHFLDNVDLKGAPIIPEIATITPTQGTFAGGTPFTITGSGFKATPTVKFGAASASNVVLKADGTLTGKTPAGPVGAVDVVVTNPSGSAGTKTGGYTYQCDVSAQSRDASEAYEDRPIGVVPDRCWYDVLVGNAGSVQANAVGATGRNSTRSHRLATTGNGYLAYEFAGLTDFCPVAPNARNIPISWDYYTAQRPSGAMGIVGTSEVTGTNSILGTGHTSQRQIVVAVDYNNIPTNPWILMLGATGTSTNNIGLTYRNFEPVVPVVEDTWYHFELEYDCYDEATATARPFAKASVQNVATGEIQTAVLDCRPTATTCQSDRTQGSAEPMGTFAFGCSRKSTGCSGGHPEGQLDNLLVRGDPVQRTVTVDLPNLVGFDASPWGSHAIARQQVELEGRLTTLKVLNGDDLHTSAVAPGDCNMIHGVRALEDVVAVINCPDTGGDYVSGGGERGVYITSPHFTKPAWPPACDEFCNQQVGFFTGGLGSICEGGFLAEQADFNERAVALQDLVDFPFNYQLISTAGSDRVLIALTYATSDGKVGTYAEVQINESNDTCSRAEAAFMAEEDIPIVCSAHDTHKAPYRNYVGAIKESTAAKFYEVTFENEDDPWYEPDANGAVAGIGQPRSPSGKYKGNALDCAHTTAIVGYQQKTPLEGGVAIFDFLTGKLKCPVILTFTPHRGVALDESARWAAYMDGNGAIQIVNVTSCENTRTLIPPVPIGSTSRGIVSFELVRGGDLLFLAADDKATRWYLVGDGTNEEDTVCTLIDQCGAFSPEDTSNPNHPDCDPAFNIGCSNEIGSGGGRGGPSTEAGAGAVNLFLGGLLPTWLTDILGVACILGGGVIGNRSAPEKGKGIGNIGALVGLGVGWTFFTIPVWFVVVGALVAILSITFALAR